MKITKDLHIKHGDELLYFIDRYTFYVRMFNLIGTYDLIAMRHNIPTKSIEKTIKMVRE